MREIRVEEYLRDEVRRTGGVCRKVVFPAKRGAPDRMIGWAVSKTGRPVHLFVELKRPAGPGATNQQKREHEALRSIGFIVEVAATKPEVDLLLAKYGPPPPQLSTNA